MKVLSGKEAEIYAFNSLSKECSRRLRKIKELQAENKRYKEALEYVVNRSRCRCQHTTHPDCINCIARQALQQQGE